MSKKKWERKECDGCKFYNPECRIGLCNIYLYQNKKMTADKKEKYNTG